MMHEVGVQLQTYLAKNGCGFPVIDGPEFRKTSTFARERVVIEHDTSGDQFGPRHRADSPASNKVALPAAARTRLDRLTAVKVTIYAQHPNKGSIYWEHIRRAEQVLDMVLIGLDVIATERQNLINFRSGKFVQPDDMKEGETPGGAVYELLLTFSRGVAWRKFDGTPPVQTVTISPQMIGEPNLTFAATAHTITRDSGSWLSDQFAVGQSIIVTGSSSNDGTYGPVTAVTDDTITFASGLNNEGPDGGISVTGNGVIISNTVSDS